MGLVSLEREYPCEGTGKISLPRRYSWDDIGKVSLRRRRLLKPVLVGAALLSSLLLASFHYTKSPFFQPASLLRPFQHYLDPPGSVTLRPLVDPNPRLPSPDDDVPWSESPFLTPSEVNDVGSWRPWGRADKARVQPIHSITAFPRKIDIPDSAPEPEEIVFGLATTAERAMSMSSFWQHWMGQGSPCLVLLPHDQRDQAEVVESFLRKKRGLKCWVRAFEIERYELRVLALVKEMNSLSEELAWPPKWFIIGDDDTFWIDLRGVQRMLSKYDPYEDHFISTSSESVDALNMFGRWQAFGGGGMVVSSGLLDKMDVAWDDCREEFKHVFGGDGIVTLCAAKARGVVREEVMTVEAGLHQMDIHGDATGFFQSGIPFLSIHHLVNSWAKVHESPVANDDFDRMAPLQAAAAFLGGDNMFRRYVFDDGKTLVVLGYSITFFNQSLSQDDLSKMEHTWNSNQPLIYPDRPLLAEGVDKVTYYLREVRRGIMVGRGKTIFSYQTASGDSIEIVWNEGIGRKYGWFGGYGQEGDDHNGPGPRVLPVGGGAKVKVQDGGSGVGGLGGSGKPIDGGVEDDRG